MTAVVAVFGSSSLTPTDSWWDEGVRLGTLLARGGATVATGGYAGMMEAVSAGAAAAGGTVVGVTAPGVFPGRSAPNGYLHRTIEAATIGERIHRLVDLADATITMPGSIGTLAEFMVAWNDAFVAPFSGRRPGAHAAVGEGWERFVEHVAAGFGADASLISCVGTVDDAARVVLEAVGLRVPSAHET